MDFLGWSLKLDYLGWSIELKVAKCFVFTIVKILSNNSSITLVILIVLE